MARGKVRATVLGFAAAFAVLAVLVWFVGVDDLLSVLARADRRFLGLVVVVTLSWLVAWGLALRTVLGVVGVDITPRSAFLVLSGAMFANNVTPFGQAGGEPVTALLISRTTDAEYEMGLAAIASVDTLNFVPSITLALVGAGYYFTEVTMGTNRNIALATVAIVVLAVGVPAIVYGAWQRRYRIEDWLVRRLTPFVRRIAGRIPRVPVPTPAGVERRIGGFFRSIERVAGDRRTLTTALGLSTLGWGCQMLALWFAFYAVGTPVPLSIVLFVVPVAAVAGLTPLPGGTGGIESVLVLLLVAAPLAGVTEPVALAAVVVYRGATYWIPVVVGGVVTGVVGLDAGV